MLPGRSGIDLLPDIRRAQPDLKILVVTMHVDRILAEPALKEYSFRALPGDTQIAALKERFWVSEFSIL